VFGSITAALEHSTLSQVSTGVAAITIGAGVPLGFLIYQLYYHAYDEWMPLSLAPQDRGGDLIKCLPVDVQTRLKLYQPAISNEEMSEPSTLPLLSLIFGQNLGRLKAGFRNRDGKKTQD